MNDTDKILEKYFPDVNMIIKNTKYNKKQDITKYFGKEIQ